MISFVAGILRHAVYFGGLIMTGEKLAQMKKNIVMYKFETSLSLLCVASGELDEEFAEGGIYNWSSQSDHNITSTHVMHMHELSCLFCRSLGHLVPKTNINCPTCD